MLCLLKLDCIVSCVYIGHVEVLGFPIQSQKASKGRENKQKPFLPDV